MRKTGICSKCTHNQLLHIGAVADTGEFDSEIRPMSLATIFTGYGFFGDEKLARAGRLTAVVCRRCGYSRSRPVYSPPWDAETGASVPVTPPA